MFSRLREHLGTAGLVVAIVALVAALGGGAYAATGGSGGGKATASAKGKQGPRGKTGKAGPAGPAGPQGSAGPVGAAGAKGDAGPAGAAGANGKDGATGPTGPAGPAGPAGEDGATGFTETLPSEATETGTWWFQGNGTLYSASPISFPIPLSPAAAASITGSHILYTGAPEFAAKCPGTINAPAAEPEFLCMYLSSESNIAGPGVTTPDFSGSPGVGTGGALLFRENLTSAQFAGGSFAITAP